MSGCAIVEPCRLRVFVGIVGLVLGGCQDGLKDTRTFVCPPRAVFEASVSELMERRCGTLDCHGNDYRPLRIYSENGLRSPREGNRTAGVATTDAEREDNYVSLCAIEPEQMQKVVSSPGGSAVNTLLLVRKARGQEGHKGGKVFNPFDDADKCVVGWLRGDSNKSVSAACESALAKLP
ncbi:MAG: hypothetical protein EXR75_12810 [Myxococcales bacterium]|nr:hypothetical protein [Myxococcales bacterium]